MPADSYATQDFFFFLGLRFPETIGATPIPRVLTFIADSYEGVLELIRVREGLPGVDGFPDALTASYVACDLALQKTFSTTLAEVYWDYARARAYENGESNVIRPTDAARVPLSFSVDRFNGKTKVEYTFTRMNDPVVISYDTNPDVLLDIPPLSTRAILLSASGPSGDLSISLNTFDWAPDAAGNSMKVNVYEEGSGGGALDAHNAQVTLHGLGATGGFTRAVVLMSNVSLDRFYSVSLIASVKAGTNIGLTGLLGGQVTDASNGDPLSSVDVVVRKRIGNITGGQIGVVSTDSRGSFLFAELPVGAVEITFSRIGYVTQKVNDTVLSGQTPTIVRVALSRAP
jgi:hypothetical protein